MKNFKFTIRGHEYEVDILNCEGNVAEIEVNGTKYEVEVNKEMQKTTTPTLVRPKIPLPKGANEIKKSTNEKVFKVEAPLPGNIIKVIAKEGDTVKKGDKLLIMEAMKMENDVKSEKDATVKTIKVNNGDTVLQGDILIELELE
ncbi:MAG: biotin/lipoyl-containing protein [Bacteroidota bacterium]|nr:biotin/lipoyl-containing protein [Bacteroidota bacterium]